jgi:hypothetical protein
MSEFKIKGKELLKKIEELIHQGNIRRIIIKDAEGKPYIEIPLTVGILGAAFAPILAAVGALAGMAAKFTVEVIKKDETEDAEIIEEEENQGI